MSNPLAIGPSVMINRLVDRSATPLDAQLAKVAQLRMALQQAAAAEGDERADKPAPSVISGADVDRLI